MQQALDGTSAIIDSEAATGGYPQVPSTAAQFLEEEWGFDVCDEEATVARDHLGE